MSNSRSGRFTLYPLNSRLGGPQFGSGRVGEEVNKCFAWRFSKPGFQNHSTVALPAGLHQLCLLTIQILFFKLIIFSFVTPLSSPLRRLKFPTNGARLAVNSKCPPATLVCTAHVSECIYTSLHKCSTDLTRAETWISILAFLLLNQRRVTVGGTDNFLSCECPRLCDQEKPFLRIRLIELAKSHTHAQKG